MAIDPSDLSPEARRALLARVRSQLGESQYRELTDRVSEDQILETLLRGPQPEPAKPARSLPDWVYIVGWIVLAAGVWSLGSGIGGRVGRALEGGGMGMILGIIPQEVPALGGAIVGGIIGGAVGNSESGAVIGILIGVGIGWLLALLARFAK